MSRVYELLFRLSCIYNTRCGNDTDGDIVAKGKAHGLLGCSLQAEGPFARPHDQINRTRPRTGGSDSGHPYSSLLATST